MNVADWSARVTLASLAKGNELFGNSTRPPPLPTNVGCVSLIQIAYSEPNVAISDWGIELTDEIGAGAGVNVN